MTKQTKTTKQAVRPSHNVYHVQDAVEEGVKSRWLKLGVAFAHEDAEGFSVLLDTIPVTGFTGRLILRVPTEKSE